MSEHAHEANESDSNDAARRFPTELDNQSNASISAQDLSRRDIRPATGGFQGGSGTQSSRMLPPLRGRSLQNMAQEEQPGQSTHEMLQRQVQAAQNMGLESPYMHGYGTGAYPTPVMSKTRTSLDFGQNGRMIPQHGSSLLPGFPETFETQSDRPHIELDDHGNNLGGISAYESRFSRRPSVFAGLGRLSAPGSRGASPKPSVPGGGLQLQGSRLPSRQASRQSSAENLRASLDSNATRMDEDGRFIFKFPMLPRNLNFKVPRLSFPILTLLTNLSRFLWSLPFKLLIPTIRLSACASTLIATTPTVRLSSPSSPCACATSSALVSTISAASAASATATTGKCSSGIARLHQPTLTTRSTLTCTTT
jgi:hypothetical protein